MRIKIVRNARDCYVASVIRGGAVDWAWADLIDSVSGQWLEVETDFVFCDQYNTAPVPGVAEQGLRVPAFLVEEVDYESDAKLAEIHQQMRAGTIRCHSYKHKTGAFVDLQP